jgi:transposase
MRVLKELCSGIKVILADGGYRGEFIENIKNKFGYVIQVVISAYKEQGFKPIHKRWIVERTFSWMENDRRLCRNYELTFDSAEEMGKISEIKLLLKCSPKWQESFGYIYRIYSIIYIIMTIYSQTVICFIKQRYICYFMTTTKAYQQSNYISQFTHNIYN